MFRYRKPAAAFQAGRDANPSRRSRARRVPRLGLPGQSPGFSFDRPHGSARLQPPLSRDCTSAVRFATCGRSAGRSAPRSSNTPESPARIAPSTSFSHVVTHAQDPLRRQAEVIAGGPEKLRMRLAVTDFRRDHQRVQPGLELGQAPHHSSQPAVEIRADAERDPHLLQGLQRRRHVREASPRRRAAEVVPELVERPIGIRQLGQDSDDDLPPSPAFGRLVRRKHPLLGMHLVALEVDLEPGPHLVRLELDPLPAAAAV